MYLNGHRSAESNLRRKFEAVLAGFLIVVLLSPSLAWAGGGGGDAGGGGSTGGTGTAGVGRSGAGSNPGNDGFGGTGTSGAGPSGPSGQGSSGGSNPGNDGFGGTGTSGTGGNAGSSSGGGSSSSGGSTSGGGGNPGNDGFGGTGTAGPGPSGPSGQGNFGGGSFGGDFGDVGGLGGGGFGADGSFGGGGPSGFGGGQGGSDSSNPGNDGFGGTGTTGTGGNAGSFGSGASSHGDGSSPSNPGNDAFGGTGTAGAGPSGPSGQGNSGTSAVSGSLSGNTRGGMFGSISDALSAAATALGSMGTNPNVDISGEVGEGLSNATGEDAVADASVSNPGNDGRGGTSTAGPGQAGPSGQGNMGSPSAPSSGGSTSGDASSAGNPGDDATAGTGTMGAGPTSPTGQSNLGTPTALSAISDLAGSIAAAQANAVANTSLSTVSNPAFSLSMSFDPIAGTVGPVAGMPNSPTKGISSRSISPQSISSMASLSRNPGVALSGNLGMAQQGLAPPSTQSGQQAVAQASTFSQANNPAQSGRSYQSNPLGGVVAVTTTATPFGTFTSQQAVNTSFGQTQIGPHTGANNFSTAESFGQNVTDALVGLGVPVGTAMQIGNFSRAALNVTPVVGSWASNRTATNYAKAAAQTTNQQSKQALQSLSNQHAFNAITSLSLEAVTVGVLGTVSKSLAPSSRAARGTSNQTASRTSNVSFSNTQAQRGQTNPNSFSVTSLSTNPANPTRGAVTATVAPIGKSNARTGAVSLSNDISVNFGSRSANRGATPGSFTSTRGQAVEGLSQTGTSLNPGALSAAGRAPARSTGATQGLTAGRASEMAQRGRAQIAAMNRGAAQTAAQSRNVTAQQARSISNAIAGKSSRPASNTSFTSRVAASVMTGIVSVNPVASTLSKAVVGSVDNVAVRSAQVNPQVTTARTNVSIPNSLRSQPTTNPTQVANIAPRPAASIPGVTSQTQTTQVAVTTANPAQTTASIPSQATAAVTPAASVPGESTTANQASQPATSVTDPATTASVPSQTTPAATPTVSVPGESTTADQASQSTSAVSTPSSAAESTAPTPTASVPAESTSPGEPSSQISTDNLNTSSAALENGQPINNGAPAGITEASTVTIASVITDFFNSILSLGVSPAVAEPLGISNNNPLNIERTNIPWEGKVNTNTGRFEQFATPEQGLRAAFKNMHAKRDAGGTVTIASLVRVWAPPSENPTNTYINRVATEVGIPANQPFSIVNNSEIAIAVAKAMTVFENGYNPYSNQQFATAYNMAFGSETPALASQQVAVNADQNFGVPVPTPNPIRTAEVQAPASTLTIAEVVSATTDFFRGLFGTTPARVSDSVTATPQTTEAAREAAVTEAAAPVAGRVTEAQIGVPGKIRSQPISQFLRDILSYAGAITNINFVVTSGGQMSLAEFNAAQGTKRVTLAKNGVTKIYWLNGEKVRIGSTRHDGGGAADGYMQDATTGRTLDFRNAADRARMSDFVEAAVRAGANGVGAGLGYMGGATVHIGGGSATSWGGAGWVGAARQAGMQQRANFDLAAWQADNPGSVRSASLAPTTVPTPTPNPNRAAVQADTPSTATPSLASRALGAITGAIGSLFGGQSATAPTQSPAASVPAPAVTPPTVSPSQSPIPSFDELTRRAAERQATADEQSNLRSVVQSIRGTLDSVNPVATPATEASSPSAVTPAPSAEAPAVAANPATLTVVFGPMGSSNLVKGPGVNSLIRDLENIGQEVTFVADSATARASVKQSVIDRGVTNVNIVGYSKGVWAGAEAARAWADNGISINTLAAVDASQGRVIGATTEIPGLTNADIRNGAGITDNVQNIVDVRPQFAWASQYGEDLRADNNTSSNYQSFRTGLSHLTALNSEARSIIVEAISENSAAPATAASQPATAPTSQAVSLPTPNQVTLATLEQAAATANATINGTNVTYTPQTGDTISITIDDNAGGSLSITASEITVAENGVVRAAPGANPTVNLSSVRNGVTTALVGNQTVTLGRDGTVTTALANSDSIVTITQGDRSTSGKLTVAITDSSFNVSGEGIVDGTKAAAINALADNTMASAITEAVRDITVAAVTLSAEARGVTPDISDTALASIPADTVPTSVPTATPTGEVGSLAAAINSLRSDVNSQVAVIEAKLAASDLSSTEVAAITNEVSSLNAVVTSLKAASDNLASNPALATASLNQALANFAAFNSIVSTNQLALSSTNRTSPAIPTRSSSGQTISGTQAAAEAGGPPPTPLGSGNGTRAVRTVAEITADSTGVIGPIGVATGLAAIIVTAIILATSGDEEGQADDGLPDDLGDTVTGATGATDGTPADSPTLGTGAGAGTETASQSLIGSLLGEGVGRDPQGTATSTGVGRNTVEVLIQVDNDTNEIYLDVIGIYDTNGNIDYEELEEEPLTEEDLEFLELFNNETQPLVLDDSGVQIIYSDGTYAPVTIGGVEQLTPDNPEYIYTIEYYENGELLEIPENATVLPGNALSNFLDRVFFSTSDYGIDDITFAIRYLLDPDENVPADEYYVYVITLLDGTERVTTVPEFTSFAFMQNRFAETGYVGNALQLVAFTEEVPPPEPVSVLDLVGQAANTVRNTIGNLFGADEDTPAVTTFGDLTPTDNGVINMEDIRAVTVLFGVEVECPNVVGSNVPYAYETVIAREALPNAETDFALRAIRCGGGFERIDYVEQVANHMESLDGFGEMDRVRLDEIIRFGDLGELLAIQPTEEVEIPVETPDTDLPPAEEEELLPNLTNEVAFEVKATDRDGNVLVDWVYGDLTINEAVELHFRWDGQAYEQCLPFLADSGNYALTRSRVDANMTTGNTESEGYNINERSGTYRVECGGQRNLEFGVDVREIEVRMR